MKVFLLWLFNAISPITSLIGFFALCDGEYEGYELIAGSVLAVVGLVVGLSSWSLTVPPRWFWAKSKMTLFNNKVWYALSYASQFFLIPYAVTGIMDIIGSL